MNSERHYIMFPSYNSGLALEALLKREKIKYTIVPTPRELSTCCGISIMYSKEDEDRIKEIVNENSISVVGFHSLESKIKNPYA